MVDAAELVTERLRLVPISLEHTEDLLTIHSDPWVVQWWGTAWTSEQAADYAKGWEWSWRELGVGKWIAYHRDGGELIGRGGPSRMIRDSDITAQISALVGERWSPLRVEMGWALLTPHRGYGYATEIGQAAMDFAFGSLGAEMVIAYTERHNRSSRAVMERVGMDLAGEILAEGFVEGLEGERPDAPFAVYQVRANERVDYEPGDRTPAKGRPEGLTSPEPAREGRE